MDVEVFLSDALAGAVDILLGGLADRPDQVALVATQAQFRADTEQGGEGDALVDLDGGAVEQDDAHDLLGLGAEPQLGGGASP